MHPSALKHAKIFFEQYLDIENGVKIIEIGSQDVNGSLKDVMPNGNYEYLGVDFVEGKNVDVILTDPYKLPFDNDSVDVIICSSCFEHSEFFWLVQLEVLRVLKPSGIFYLNVPSNGYVHRYPLDCWRFYPDSGKALVNWGNRNGYSSSLLESFIGSQGGVDDEERWNDFVCVILKDKKYLSKYKNRMSEHSEYKMVDISSDDNNALPEDFTIINELRNRLSQVNSKLEVKESKIALLEEEAKKNKSLLCDAEKNMNDLRIYQHSLVNSSSWKVTRPLRLVKRGVVLSSQVSKVLLSNPASFKTNVKKSMSLYKSLGLKGFISFLNNKTVNKTLLVNATIGSDGFDRNDYSAWIKKYDVRTEHDLKDKSIEMEDFSDKPLISIVMPTYKPDPLWLKDAIESVINQCYSNWELCIADDCSDDVKVTEVLEHYSSIDDRIKVIFRKDNGHISAASNDALSIASGKWVALLDHDDLLADISLFEVVKAINSNPDAALIYSDEDKVDENGMRMAPYFKPNWNRELLYSHNVICHLGVYRKDVLDDIGGFRIGYEGAQDLDLALRVIEIIEDNQIVHIPRILYHWRVHSGSTASTTDNAKPYAMLAGQRALNDHFNRVGISARSELIGSGFRTHYSLEGVTPLVSIIIPTKNGYHLTKQCIDSIFDKTTYKNFEIILIDNNSDEKEALDYFSSLKSHKKVTVIRDDGEFNYSRINNEAIKSASGEYIVLLNNDIEVISPDWLYELLSNAIRNDVGIVGAKLLYPDNTVQHSGVILGIGGWAGHAHKGLPAGLSGYSGRNVLASEFSAVTAACLIIEKKLFDEVGGLNQDDLKVACNDVELCLKVSKAGYRIIWTPYATLYHHESITRGYEDTPEKVARFESELSYMKENWGDVLSNDPHYNPNLTIHHEDFSLAWPPRIDD